MVDCNECKQKRAEGKTDTLTSMRFAHEREVAVLERIIKRMWITILVLIVMLVGTNAAWLYHESQFEDVVTTQTVTQDAKNGTNNFVGGDYNGEANSDNDN